MIVSKKYNFDVTPDGHYGLTYNLAPSTAVTVTDLKARKPVGSIAIPGCGLIFAQAPNRFSSLCADGSVATVTFDESAQGSIKRAEKVFDAKNDPAFEHSAWDKKHQMLYLVTYSGDVVPVSLAGEVAGAAAKWSLTTQAERAAGWRPGGWQVSHFHSANDVCTCSCIKDAHGLTRTPGTEVWEFDAVAGKRLQRIKLDEPAQTVAVSGDDSPLVYVITDSRRHRSLSCRHGQAPLSNQAARLHAAAADRMGRVMDPLLELTIAWSLAVLFAASTAHKLAALGEWPGVVRNYRVLPRALALPAAGMLLIAGALTAAALLLARHAPHRSQCGRRAAHPFRRRPWRSTCGAGAQASIAAASARACGREFLRGWWRGISSSRYSRSACSCPRGRASSPRSTSRRPSPWLRL